MKKILKKIGNYTKKAWTVLNGKKRAIGLGIFFINSGLRAFFSEAMTPDQFAFVDLTAALVGGTGIFHAVIKEREKKIGNNATKINNKITKL